MLFHLGLAVSPINLNYYGAMQNGSPIEEHLKVVGPIESMFERPS